jgi:dipeptidyl aminopeptidase/acylaminoacyl peptidase
VAFYGVFDFLNRNGTRPNWPVIPRLVMKSDPALNPESFRAASPLDHVGPHAPPFLVIHGAWDGLVPPAESVQFVEALRGTSAAPVSFMEVPGANHAFDVVGSVRTAHVVSAVHAFLDSARVAHAGFRADGPGDVGKGISRG